MNIGAGVYSRWNNAGLDSSICDLRKAHPSSLEYGSTAENEDDPELPRAEYCLLPASPSEHAVGATLRMCTLVIKMWFSDEDDLETALDLTELMYDNCESAATSPLTVAGGNVTRVQFSGRESGPVNENVYLGTVEFEIEVQRANTTPA
jgi:hypothetical protein